MSGGSYDYAYGRVEDMADSLALKNNPRRESFKKLLKLVSQAMHDIEWVDSCDYSPGNENEAIDACFAFLKADPSIIAKAHAFDALAETLKEYFKLEAPLDRTQ